MANSSFPSLEDSSLVDDLASDIARQPPPMQNFVDDFVKDEFSRTQAAARYAKQFDPQSYARAEKLAPGISPEVGIRQLQLLEDTANLARYQDIFQRAPSLRGYFAENPKELPKATPDDLDNLSGLSWLGNAAVDSYRQGFIDMQAAFASNRVARAQLSGQTPSIEDQAFLNNYQGGRTFGADGFWSEAFTMAAQQIGPLLGTMAATFNTGVVGGTGGAVYGSVVPGVGTVAGLATGAAAGSIAGGYAFQQQLQTGMSRLYFQTIKDENGKGLEPELIELASQITGAGGALLESVSLGNIARVIPGSERLVGLLTKQGMATALQNPAVRGALLNFAKNTMNTAAVEVTTEVLQQGLQIAAGELAKADSNYNRSGDNLTTQVQPTTEPVAFNKLRPFVRGEYRQNEDGSYSTEVLVTIQDQDGRFVNVPSLWNSPTGYVDFGDDEDAVFAAMQAYESANGPTFPRFNSVEEAVSAAESRSSEGGASGGEFSYLTPEEIAEQLLDAGRQAFQVMALMGPLISSTRFGTDLIEVSRSNREHEAIKKVMADVEGNQLIQRDPELAQRLIDKQTGDQQLYIPARELVTLFQEQGLDRYGPPLPNWRSRLDEALATNGDVKVSLGEFIAHLSKDPKENPLLALVRTNPNGFTQQELSLYNEAQQELLLSEVAQAQRRGDVPLDRVTAQKIEVFPELEELRKQVEAIGFDKKAVDAYTTIFSAFFQTLAQKAGVSPFELFNEYSVEVQRGLLNSNYEAPEGAPIPAGATTFEENKAVISMYESADMSTMLHEAGHFFLNTFSKLAEKTPELALDWDTIKRKLKIEGEITREQHEQFARWTEAYFMEGKAPSPELKGPFEQFRRWLKTVYRTIQKLGGRVSPEISQVFDRMFVVDDRLEQIALDNAYAPLFKTAEEMGVPLEEYLAYQQLVEDLKEDASAKSRERIVGQVKRLETGWMGEIEKQLVKEAEEKLRQQPPYTHMETLKQGKIAIARDALVQRYSEEAVKAFPSKGVKKAGMDPDVVAELLGYPSADDMVYDFTQALPIKEAAKEAAYKEMVTRYGEDYSQPELLDAAIKRQLAQDGRMQLLGKELSVLSRKAGKTVSEKMPRQLAVEIARDVIYAKKVGELAPAQTQAAVRRNARMAEAAAVKGKWAEAADYKRKQLLAQALDNEAQKASAVLEKIRNKAARYSRTTPPSVDPSYMEQIRSLVEQYDFARISGKKLKKRLALREFLQEAEAEGLVPIDIPERLLRDAGKVNYKELTVEDLIGLGDTLDNLEHLGRVKNRLKTKMKAAEFAAVKQQILNVTNSLPQKQIKADPYGNHEQPLRDWLTAFHANNLKPEQIVEWLDAGQIHGPLAEHVFNPIADAQNYQNDLNMEYNQKLVEIFQDIPSKHLSESISIPELNGKLTREQIYAAALNTGNVSSRRKLLEGELWSEEQLAAVLSHMGKEDWDRVQKVWNLLNSLWPKIASLEKRLTGVTPPKIEARAFTTPFGEYEGGYYPVVYDFKVPRGRNLIEDTTPRDRVIGDGLFVNNNIRPGTNHKHTVKRSKTAKVIRLELGVLPGHINNVIHDLAYREAIRSAYKVLWDPDIAQSIRKAEGDQVYRQLQHWLKAVASEHAIESDPGHQLIARLRTGATMYGMGYRLTTVVSQLLGIFPAMTRVGASNLLSAAYQMARHPYQTWEMVSSLSGEMKHRFNQQERDIKDTVRGLMGKGSKLDIIKGYAFWAIGWMDRGVSTAVWLGAYQQQMAKTPGDPNLALRHADRTVRLTQGTGSVKDLAKVMNNGELGKLFTMFYSAFSAQYNMQADLTRKTKRDIAAGDMNRIFMERVPQWIYLVPIPAILGALISGQGPEDDENIAWWATKTTLMYPIAAVPFLRDIIGSAESGFGYKFTPASKAFDSTVSAARELGKLFSEDEEFNPTRFAKTGAGAAAITMKLPAGQAINTVEGLWKGLENGDFEPQDLVYGRRGK